MKKCVRIVAILLAGSVTRGADRYVWLGAPSSSPPYESWETAATNIQDAIDAASAGETIWVTNGTYVLNQPLFIGSAVTLKSVNGRDATVITRNPSLSIRLLVLSNANAVVEGFSFTNGLGRAPALNQHSYGGALAIYNGTVRDSRIATNICQGGYASENNYHAYGGGIYLVTGRLENCEIVYNTARGSGGSSSAFGGGLYAIAGEIENCVIASNAAWATGNGRGQGGGVQIMGISRLTGSRVIANRAQGANNYLDAYGGGIYMEGAGLVSNCVIQGNSIPWHQSWGGGVYMTSGLVTHSLVASNRVFASVLHWDTSTPSGGGLYVAGTGVVRSSLIYENRAEHTGQFRPGSSLGGGVYLTNNGSVVHCTITRNGVTSWSGGLGDGVYVAGGTLSNSIVAYNVTNYNQVPFLVDQENVRQVGGIVSYSCVPRSQGIMGVSNVFADPGFWDAGAFDFRLLPGSPCLDSAATIAAVTTDYAGNPRGVDGDGDGVGAADMGALEALAADEGPLRAGFRVVPEDLFDGGNFVWTASVAGSNTTGLIYSWDLDADEVVEYSGSDRQTVTQAVGIAGYRALKLTVENGISETTAVVRPAAVRVHPSVLYVRQGGSGTPPYETPAKGTTNLAAALYYAEAGSKVSVGEGAFGISNLPIVLRRGVTIEGVRPADSILERRVTASMRLFLLSHSNAVLRNLTLRNGLYQLAGLARGGAVIMAQGLVENCVLTNNVAWGKPNQQGLGGAVYLMGGTVRNCLIAYNQAKSDNQNSGGGGIYMLGGSVENCTIVSNHTSRADASGTNDITRGGGVYLGGGGVTNSIVYFNSIRVETPFEVNIKSSSATTNARYSCSTDLDHNPSGTGNITNDPLLVDRFLGNFRLTPASPCLNAGTSLLWHASAMDLDDKPRVKVGKVDMGAYEWQPPAGTLMMIR